MPKTTPRSPSLIDAAPLEVPQAHDDEYVDFLVEYSGTLSARLEAAEAELEAKEVKKTIDDVRAGMLEGYSNRVFWFVVWYCMVVGLLLIASGFSRWTTFHLSDTILGIIAGSTAVSVIGLIGMVITGLFGGRALAAGKKAKTKKAPRT